MSDSTDTDPDAVAKGRLQEPVRSPASDTDTSEQETTEPIAAVATPPGDDVRSDPMQEILAALRHLGEEYSLKLKYDHAKERLIDALDEEVKRHRQGLHFTLMRPVFLDLITLHDELGKCAAAATDQNTARTLQSFVSTVEEVMARNGAEPFRMDGAVFDGKRQKALRTVPTANVDESGQVAEHVRNGFEYEGRVLRPELVTTYRYAAPLHAALPAETDAEPTTASSPDQ